MNKRDAKALGRWCDRHNRKYERVHFPGGAQSTMCPECAETVLSASMMGSASWDFSPTWKRMREEDFSSLTLADNPPACDVCNGESGSEGSTVFRSALGGVPLTYCDACLVAGAEPAELIRTAVGRVPSRLAEWFTRSVSVWTGKGYTLVCDLPSTFWSGQ